MKNSDPDLDGIAASSRPYLVAVNLTERCNLRCDHCYLDAGSQDPAGNGELTHTELAALFAEIAARAPGTIIVLTGGEPLLRPDLQQIVRSGARVGLRMVLGSNGVILNDTTVQALRHAGLSGMGISIDSVYAEQHDRFRGVPGAHQRSCAAVRLCKIHGLHVQIHFTVTQANHQQLQQAVDLAQELGASILNFFFLVCVGRGKSVLDLSPALYESALQEISRLQKTSSGIMVQARCAPHFKRILYQDNPDSQFTRAQGYDGGGCIAASHYCRITPVGEMTPCPYIEATAGNIRDTPFWDLWSGAPLFQAFNNPALEGRCEACEYTRLCGGCRARSVAGGGGLMGEDPSCAYIPQGGAVISVLDNNLSFDDSSRGDEDGACAIQWTREALERLDRIPIFLRNRIKGKLEARALQEGHGIITADMMKKYRSERERELGIKFTS